MKYNLQVHGLNTWCLDGRASLGGCGNKDVDLVGRSRSLGAGNENIMFLTSLCKHKLSLPPDWP